MESRTTWVTGQSASCGVTTGFIRIPASELARNFDETADAVMRMAIDMAQAAAPTTVLRAVPLPRFAGEDR